ncbi:MAG: NADPH-dependent FMN reductase [Myxococcaceae bacterium]
MATDVMAVCGSYRSKSLNRKLLRLLVREVKALGLTVEEVDLKILALPDYDGDLEETQGLPASVLELKKKLSATPGLLIASPEYNGSIPGGFKNFIDWMSRPPGNPFENRVVSINTVSSGQWGGVRGTIAIKSSLTHLDAWIVPGAMNLPKGETAFDESGELKEEWTKKALNKAMSRFAEGVKRFRS